MKLQQFFDTTRDLMFGGTLSQRQVDGIQSILTACDKHAVNDLRQRAYILGTVYHEAGKGMYPVRESFAPTNEQAIANVTAMFKAGQIKHNYALPDPVTHQSYYGRGYVQITWNGNYEAFAKMLNIDLVNKPDLALQPDISAQIAVIGMKDGVFTGRKLSDYFNMESADFFNARKIINGMDKADIIAGYAMKFYNALNKA